MFSLKKNNKQENLLYNDILILSRNKFFYTNLDMIDTFQNRIHLIFVHISFIFIKVKTTKNNKIYKIFYQKMFDLIFSKIEENMREIGHGDTYINKNMRLLVKIFYTILIKCEDYKNMDNVNKIKFLNRFFKKNKQKINPENKGLIDYFNKYEAFCFDLTSDSVLKGELKFNYK